MNGIATVAVGAGGFVGEKIAERVFRRLYDDTNCFQIEKEENVQSNTQYYQAKEIGHSTLVSISTVWEALDEAAGVLFDTTVATTNTVLKHKYGTNVADTVTVCSCSFVFTS